MALKIKEVTAEQKSAVEVENELLEKHEEKLNEDTKESSEETKITESSQEAEKPVEKAELQEEEVLSYLKNRYGKEINSFDDLSPGALGVLEPSPEKRIRITPESINLVIIPGVAFDLQGGRIGYGKGYYDRFLEQTKAFRLALAFDFQIIDKVPTEKHDVPMNGILSESGIFEVNN